MNKKILAAPIGAALITGAFMGATAAIAQPSQPPQHSAPVRPAGISFAGYAQIAQAALQHAGGYYGYKVRCTAADISRQLDFKVICVMTETGKKQ